MKIKSDSKFDQELEAQKKALDNLNRAAQKFISTHSDMPVRERALELQSIQNQIKKIAGFLSQPHAHNAISAGQKFSLDNLRNSLASFKSRWVVFEKSILD